ATERRVACRRGRVETERDGLRAGRLQVRDHSAVQPRRRAGRDRYAEPEAARVADQLEQVRALERIAAGEDDVRQRMPEAREIGEQPPTFRRRQLVRMRPRDGVGAAMAADETARARRFPIDAPWRTR